LLVIETKITTHVIQKLIGSARPARLAQQHAEPFPARVLQMTQWRSDHTVILIPV